MRLTAVIKGGIAGLVTLIVCVMGASIVDTLAFLRDYDGLAVLIVTVGVGFLTDEAAAAPLQK